MVGGEKNPKKRGDVKTSVREIGTLLSNLVTEVFS
jgi:hypothetical protein